MKLCRNRECDVCYNRSFALHPRANCWNNEKNELKPWMVRTRTHDKYWFDISFLILLSLKKLSTTEGYMRVISLVERKISLILGYHLGAMNPIRQPGN